MSHPIILDFDHSVGLLNDAQTIALSHWQEKIRFGCSVKQFEKLNSELNQLLPTDHGPVFLGSGDYHHVSLLLIKRLSLRFSEKNPIQVVILDNHPDNMRYLFGIHCGSWVSYVASLPFVSHVHVVGITSSDIGLSHFWENRWRPLFNGKLSYWSMNVDTGWTRTLGLQSAYRSSTSADGLIASFIAEQTDFDGGPIYLSIDKDVLSDTVIKTNWDQGNLQTYHILDLISALGDRIIAADITGDVSNYQYHSRYKRIMSLLDKQPVIAPHTLQQWQQQQHMLNQVIADNLKAHTRVFNNS